MVSRALLRWYKVTYGTVVFLSQPYLKFIKHYSWKRVRMKHHPNLVFSNHTTLVDHLLVGVPLHTQMYFVAGEHLFRNTFLRRFVLCLDGLIIRKKGAPADDMIVEMKDVLTSGGNVWMSPEGTRSINGESTFISPATGKLVKECAELGAGLVTYRIHGGYLQSPRWAKYKRKGKMWGEFVHEYMPEELMAMSLDEVNRHIREDLYVNTFDDQKLNPKPYKGKNLAENLETTLYVCPKCHQIGKLSSKGDILSCQCGYKVRFTEHALFEGVEGHEVIIDNIAYWDHWQRDYLKSKIPEFMAYPPDKIVDSDTQQTLNRIGALKSVECLGHGTFALYRDRFEFQSQSPEKTFVFPFTEIAGFAFSLQMKILFSLKDGTYYEVNSAYPRSAFKYMVLYRNLIGKEYY